MRLRVHRTERPQRRHENCNDIPRMPTTFSPQISTTAVSDAADLLLRLTDGKMAVTTIINGAILRTEGNKRDQR